MKKTYEKPKIEVSEIKTDDVIMISTPLAGKLSAVTLDILELDGMEIFR